MRLAHAGVEPTIAAALARRLGATAWRAVELARGPHELVPLRPGSDLTAAEVRAHLRYGGVVRLEDLLVRRARFALWQPEMARELLRFLQPLCAQELGWDGRRWGREEEGCVTAMANWNPQLPSVLPAITETPS